MPLGHSVSLIRGLGHARFHPYSFHAPGQRKRGSPNVVGDGTSAPEANKRPDNELDLGAKIRLNLTPIYLIKVLVLRCTNHLPQRVAYRAVPSKTEGVLG